MKLSQINQIAVFTVIGLAVTQSFKQLPAQAIVITDPVGPIGAQNLGTPLTGVVEISLDGSLCSGGLINANTVITAQHCTFGVSANSIRVNFHENNDGAPELAVNVASKFEFDTTNNLLDGTDVAILTLTNSVDTNIFNPLGFFAGNPTGVTATTAGFGLNGIGSTGHQGSRDGLRWAGENVIDFYGAARGSGGFALGGTANIFSTDFDNPTGTTNTLPGSSTALANEATTAPGDSGGPLLVNGLIAGVLSSGTTSNSAYGDISWWTGTNQFRSTIEQFGGTFVDATVVPEPLTILGSITAFSFGVFFKRKTNQKN